MQENLKCISDVCKKTIHSSILQEQEFGAGVTEVSQPPGSWPKIPKEFSLLQLQ